MEFDNEKDDELSIDGETLKRYFVHAKLEKTCTCKPKSIKIDVANRELECSVCGAKLDPFDVVVELYRQEDRYWTILKGLREQCEEFEKWQLNNKMGKTLRAFASQLRRGLIPKCPHCKEPFDFDKITTWCSKEYAINNYQTKIMGLNND